MQVMQNKKNMKYAGKRELFLSENYLKFYNSIIVKLVSRKIKNKKKVLEFGAGIGALATLYYHQNKVMPECVEIDKSLRTILTNRNLKVYKFIGTKKYNAIYSSNVLEHIKNDIEILKTLHSSLNKNGLLVLYLPAFNCLFSELDRTVGHYRRYEKKDIVSKLLNANFKIIDFHYVDSLGFFASFFIKFLGYKRNGINCLASASSYKIYDSYIFPLSFILDQIGLKYLFGKNLLVVAKKSI